MHTHPFGGRCSLLGPACDPQPNRAEPNRVEPSRAEPRRACPGAGWNWKFWVGGEATVRGAEPDPGRELLGESAERGIGSSGWGDLRGGFALNPRPAHGAPGASPGKAPRPFSCQKVALLGQLVPKGFLERIRERSS